MLKYGLSGNNYILATIHRDFNTDNAERFAAILKGLNSISKAKGLHIQYPLHPRARKKAAEFGLEHLLQNLITTEPLGYIELMSLLQKAKFTVTDSGGFQVFSLAGIRKLREESLKAGLIHPKTHNPFPADALRALAPGRRFLVIEQNTGQMVEDVRLSLMGENARVDWPGVMPGLFIGAEALEDPSRQACKEN